MAFPTDILGSRRGNHIDDLTIDPIFGYDWSGKSNSNHPSKVPIVRHVQRFVPFTGRATDSSEWFDRVDVIDITSSPRTTTTADEPGSTPEHPDRAFEPGLDDSLCDGDSDYEIPSTQLATVKHIIAHDAAVKVFDDATKRVFDLKAMVIYRSLELPAAQKCSKDLLKRCDRSKKNADALIITIDQTKTAFLNNVSIDNLTMSKSLVAYQKKVATIERGVCAGLVVSTTGKGEDGWTPKANGMIIVSEEMHVDDLGILISRTSDEVTEAQRRGRVGRVEDHTFLQLGVSAEPSSTWRMHYAEKRKVCLAAMDLGFNDEILGLIAAHKEEAEADLVSGDMVLTGGDRNCCSGCTRRTPEGGIRALELGLQRE